MSVILVGVHAHLTAATIAYHHHYGYYRHYRRSRCFYIYSHPPRYPLADPATAHGLALTS